MVLHVRVIALEETKQTHPLKGPFPDVQTVQAVDLRATPPLELLRAGAITTNAFESISHGRKYHSEVPSSAAVGLVQSWVKALESTGDGHLLLCEEDCVPKHGLKATLTYLIERAAGSFDIVAIGTHNHSGTESHESNVRGFVYASGYFFGTHCVLVHQAYRKKLLHALRQPLDVQLDALLSRMALYQGARLMVQRSHSTPLAVQRAHESSIQSGTCVLCEVKPGVMFTPLNPHFLLAVNAITITVCALLILRVRKR